MVFGLQTQPKSWLTGYTFWVNHYLEIVFSKISVVNPPLKSNFVIVKIYYVSETVYVKLGDGCQALSIIQCNDNVFQFVE